MKTVLNMTPHGDTKAPMKKTERTQEEIEAMRAYLSQVCHSGVCDFVPHPCGLHICPRRRHDHIEAIRPAILAERQ
jgi:hypothetical protein